MAQYPLRRVLLRLKENPLRGFLFSSSQTMRLEESVELERLEPALVAFLP